MKHRVLVFLVGLCPFARVDRTIVFSVLFVDCFPYMAKASQPKDFAALNGMTGVSNNICFVIFLSWIKSLFPAIFVDKMRFEIDYVLEK